MASLTTRYMGLFLDCPLVASASPLSREIATCRQLEDAGASAIVLFSLFEEQFAPDKAPHGTMPWHALDASAFLVDSEEFFVRPHQYLEHVRHVKAAVDVPVIGSLNAVSPGRWTQYAEQIQQAGADGLELNIYSIVSDPTLSGSALEARFLELLEDVKSKVTIPVALKLSPYFTSLAATARRFDAAGVDALVLFNRSYQPEIDIERREIRTSLELSLPHEGRLPMLWIALLKDRIRASLAATTGIHSAEDAIKMIMAGADVTMVCSVLLRHGVGHLGELRRGMESWLDSHGYKSIDEIRGVMCQERRLHREDFERAGYAKVLSRYW
jgi:dihydroorotate dehydrogenase (fumarate)